MRTEWLLTSHCSLQNWGTGCEVALLGALSWYVKKEHVFLFYAICCTSLAMCKHWVAYWDNTPLGSQFVSCALYDGAQVPQYWVTIRYYLNSCNYQAEKYLFSYSALTLE